MSDADRTQVAYIAEVTYGTAPGGAWKVLRLVSESLKQNTSVTRSHELRADRQVPDVIRTDISGGGGIEGELSYATWDDFIQWSLFSAGWSSIVTVGPLATISVTNAGASTFEFTRSAGSWITDGILANQWVRSTGFVNAGNNGVFKVTAVTALVLTLRSYNTQVNEAAGPSVTIVQGAQVVNGTTQTSIAMERQFTDLSNIWSLHTGNVPNKLDMKTGVKQLLMMAFDFIGQKMTPKTAQTAGSYTAANTNSVLNAIDNVYVVVENSGQIDVVSVNFSVNNNLRGRSRVGTLGLISVGNGKCEVTGDFEGYFSDNTLISQYTNFSAVNIAIVVNSAEGLYVIECPRIKLTDGANNATGENSDIMGKYNWSAMRHPTEGVTVRVARFLGP